MTQGRSNYVTRVLICGTQFPGAYMYTRKYLQKYPFIQVDNVPLSDVPKVIANYHICIAMAMKLDSSLISSATQMKLIMQYGVGLEGVDVNAATICGIRVARISGGASGNLDSCAEMAIYLMLGLLRKQKELQVSIEQRKLGVPIGNTLLGKTVFIMGFGNIGVALAKRLRPFGVRILATKRSWASQLQDPCDDEDGIDNLVDEKGAHSDLHKFAGVADIVVCCLSLNNETAGIVDKPFLASMKKGSLLVNVARGGLLDYEAVSYFLKTGHLGGLGMDVAWTEPFDPNDPVLGFNNVILTPHVAGFTEHSCSTMSKIVGDVALQLHAGAPLTGIEFVN